MAINENKHFTSIGILCNIPSTYNFVKGVITPIGFINALSLSNGGGDLLIDAPFCDFLDPNSKPKQTGAIETCDWDGGPTDNMHLIWRISPGNRAKFRTQLASLTGGSEVDLQWTIGDYDHDIKDYFKTFHSGDKKLKCIIAKGTRVEIDPMPATDVTNPPNYRVHMTVTPKSEGEEQVVHVAYSADSPFTMRWGMPVGA